jgi:hypothetical protein
VCGCDLYQLGFGCYGLFDVGVQLGRVARRVRAGVRVFADAGKEQRVVPCALGAWEYKLPEFWRSKLRSNRKRDQRNFRRLRAADWTVIRLWEHEIRLDSGRCIDRILRAL